MSRIFSRVLHSKYEFDSIVLSAFARCKLSISCLIGISGAYSMVLASHHSHDLCVATSFVLLTFEVISLSRFIENIVRIFWKVARCPYHTRLLCMHSCQIFMHILEKQTCRLFCFLTFFRRVSHLAFTCIPVLYSTVYSDRFGHFVPKTAMQGYAYDFYHIHCQGNCMQSRYRC